MSWNGNDLFNSTLMGGMPSGADPHQYLTTDGNGMRRWEDKLAYDETRYATVVPTTHFTTWGSAPQSVNVENIVLPRDGSTCRITLDEQVYECEATVSAEDSATLKVTSSFTITVHSDYFFIVGTPGGSEHTIHIEEIIRDFKPLDPKYLPSGSGGGGVIYLPTFEGEGSVAVYAYADAELTTRLTYEQGKDIVRGPFVLGMQDGGDIASFAPIMMATDSDAMTIQCVIANTNNMGTVMLVLVFSDTP